MYNFLLKYFYSWYILPMILIHESCHVIAGFIFRFKILDFKLYKQENPPIYNSYIVFAHRKYDWKWSIVLYAPVILVLPILLCFLHPILFYVALYFVSTIMFYDKKIICAFLPSIADRMYKKRVNYYSYLVEYSSYGEFNYYLKIRRLNDLITKYHLMTEREYFFEKK